MLLLLDPPSSVAIGGCEGDPDAVGEDADDEPGLSDDRVLELLAVCSSPVADGVVEHEDVAVSSPSSCWPTMILLLACTTCAATVAGGPSGSAAVAVVVGLAAAGVESSALVGWGA